MIVDKQARALQCPQCGAWCLLGQVDGFKTVANAHSVPLAAAVVMVTNGLRVYRYERGKLKGLNLADLRPADVIHAEHPCKAFAGEPLDVPMRERRGVSPCRWAGGAGKVTGECLRSPEEAAQGVVSCQSCEPPPFDLDQGALDLFVTMLGAKVIEVIEHDEPLARMETDEGYPCT